MAESSHYLELMRKEAGDLFEIYKRLESKRIREYQLRGDPAKIEARKADDHFILYIALHLLIQGNVHAYHERKTRLIQRAQETREPDS